MHLKAAFVFTCVALLLVVAPAGAHQYRVGPLLVVHPHAVSLVPGRPVVVYMTVVNEADTGDALVKMHCPRASRAELHQHVMTDGIMKMGDVAAIEIPPQGKAELKPGGYHVMLFDVTGSLAPGDRLPLELEFRSAGRVAIEAVVEKPGASDEDASGHGEHSTTQ